MYLDAYLRRLRREGRAEVDKNLALARENVNEALEETRRIMSELRPAVLDDLGLDDALRSSLGALAERAGVTLTYHAEVDDEALPSSVEIVLFRVAHEAFNNALKHSGSDRVAVSLHASSDGTLLRVQDWGCGIEPVTLSAPREPGRHLGLVGMRERAELVGGELAIESVPGEGTTVTLALSPATVVAGAGAGG